MTTEPTQSEAQGHAAGVDRALDVSASVLALAVIPALLLEDASSSTLRTIGLALNWTIWLVFVAEYGRRLFTAPARLAFVRRAWFDLAVILLTPPFVVPAALQGARTIRVARGLRLFRVVRSVSFIALSLRHARRFLVHHHFRYVLLVVGATIGLGALGIWMAERDVNKSLTSFVDAIWWAFVTATTVGYGDVSPVTTEGRIVAVALMIVGIGAIGVFTATITSLFFQSDREDAMAAVEQRLAAIESSLSRMESARQQDPGEHPG